MAASPAYHWGIPGGEGQFSALLEDRQPLLELARIVQENEPRGLVTVLPPRPQPWDFGKAYDANIFDYLAQVGIPLLPRADFPDGGDVETAFLSLHARSVAGHETAIEQLAERAPALLVTDGLAATLSDDLLARPNIRVIEASVTSPKLFDYQGVPDPYDIGRRLRPIPVDRAWEALRSEGGWDSSMRYEGNEEMAARIFDAPTLDSLRDWALAPFGLSLRGPARVGLQPLGENYVVLHNSTTIQSRFR